MFSQVGGHEDRRFEGRVIAATHRDLDEARAERRFRDDFYYRLCSDEIVVPPLRVRLAEEPRELDVLLEALVERIMGEPDAEVVASVRGAIESDLPPGYGWPGNVRELEQVVRRVLLTGGCVPRAASPSAGGDDFLDAVQAGELTAKALTERYCALLHGRLGTYEEVARVTGLDRRTVRKYVVAAHGED